MKINEIYKNDEQLILKLVKNSIVSPNSVLKAMKIEEKCGWAYISVKNDEYEFSINYSSCMFDLSNLIEFLAEIINLKEDIALYLDYEGSEPLLYAKEIDDNKIRFIFAHDYELFLNDDIDNYDVSSYKIECDIIIDKKNLLEQFYNILLPFVENYDLKESYYPEINLKKCKKYLNIIKNYLSN